MWNFLLPAGTKELKPFSSVFVAVFEYVFLKYEIKTFMKAAFQRKVVPEKNL